jgi:hypothetical protein
MLGNDYVDHEKCFNFCLVFRNYITRIIFKTNLNFRYCITEKIDTVIFLMENALYQFIRWRRDRLL